MLSFNEKDFRTDFERFFEISDVLGTGKLCHRPFIVFDTSSKRDEVVVSLVENAGELILNYTDEIVCIAQWGGRWRSDFIKFKVGDVRAALSKKNE